MKDPKLNNIARAGSTSKPKSLKNISRNFHQNLVREKRLLQVKVTMVKLRVLVHRPKVRQMKLDYPFIRLIDWAQYLLQHHSEHVLGGHNIQHVAEYTAMFRQFWRNYYNLDPSHECYVKFKKFADMGSLIPFCIHGDEGRGKAKIPILITAYQFVIGVHGEQHTNMKGYPAWPCVVWGFCLRLVFLMVRTCLH